MTKRFRLQEVDDVFYIIDGKYSTEVNQYRLTPKNIVNLLNSFDETLEYFYNISSDGELIKELHEENQMLKELLKAANEEIKPKYDTLAKYAKTKFMGFDD